MSLVTHIFRKDVRHLRWLLVGWFLLVALQTGLMASGAAAWNNDAALQMALQMLGWLVPFLKWILLIVLIPLLIQDEPLTGHTAFWFTRPIGRADLLKSKALFLVLLVVLPPAAAEFATLAAHGIGPADLSVALPEILWDAALSLLPVVALAAITGTFARFAVTGVSIYASLMVLGFAWQMYRMFTDMEGMVAGMSDPSLQLSKHVVGGLLGLLLLGFTIVWQYLTRRTAVAVAALGLYAALTVAVNQAWSWDFMAAPGPAPTVAGEPVVREVRLGSMHSSDASMTRRGQEREKELRAHFICSDLPPAHFARVKKVDATVTFSDGVETNYHQEKRDLHFSNSIEQDALEQTLTPLRLISESRSRHSSYSRLIKIKADLFDQYRLDEAELKGEAEMNLFRYEIAARLPLQVGQGAQVGTTAMTISDILKNPGGCTVVLGERRFALKFKKQRGSEEGLDFMAQLNRKAFYVLVNQRLGEAYRAEDDDNLNFNPFRQSGRLEVDSPRHTFMLKENGLDVLRPPEDVRDWLRDAELWWINIVEAGSFTARLHENPFWLDDDRGSKTHRHANTNALAAITLPDTPTEDQVRGYIRQIARASERQNRRSSSDPQTKMLVRVGSANLHLLLESLRLYPELDFYLLQAIGDVAGPNDKERILAEVRHQPDLLQVVQKKKWMQDLDPYLAELFKKSDRYEHYFR